MKAVTHNESGKRLTVKVATDAEGYKFPANHPTELSTDGTKEYNVIEVTYYDLEATDVVFTDEVTAQYAKLGFESKDIIKACSAGLRLMVGDGAKEQFKVKQGVKELAAAMQWIATDGAGENAKDLLEYSGKAREAKTDDEKAAVNKWLLEKYHSRNG